jgi:Family of unknown function (DUF6134)
MKHFLVAFALLLPTAAQADGRQLVFDLYRKNDKVGTHKISFTQLGDVLEVDIAIDIRSKILFLPFRYQHRNKERWRGSTMLSLESQTQVNDRKDVLSVRASRDGFDVTANGKASRIEGDIKSTSYWLSQTVAQARLLNSQKGKVIFVTASAPKSINVPATGGSLAARETRMADTKNFNVNVSYDSKGCLVGMSFKPPIDSTPIVYRLVSRPEAARAPDLLANPLMAPCLVNGPQTAEAANK